jgi:hypothetical protein
MGIYGGQGRRRTALVVVQSPDKGHGKGKKAKSSTARENATGRRQGADPAPSLDLIEDALKGHPNDFEEEDDFFQAMMCIYGASGGDEAFFEKVVKPWALGWSENTPEYVQTKWDYAKRHGTCLVACRIAWRAICHGDRDRGRKTVERNQDQDADWR